MLNEVSPTRNDYVASGGATFSYTFRILAASDLQVFKNGIEQLLTTHYTVLNIGSPSGSITFVTVPANGDKIAILRRQPISQLSDYLINEALPSDRVETDLDKVVMVMQMLAERIGRSLTFTPSSLSRNIVLPDPASGNAVRWRADLAGMENFSVGVGAIGTPVSIAQGGTGAATAAGARTNLGVGQSFVLLTDFGAVGDDATDNTTPMVNAIASLPARGGTIICPAGIYRFVGQINVDDKRSIVFQGSSGLASGAETATVLKYTGSGTSPFISVKSSFGISFRDIMIVYTSGSFTGNLIDCQHSAAALDTTYFSMRSCFVGGSGVATAATLVYLDKAIIASIEQCTFGGAVIAIYGRAIAGSYSNVIRVRDCTFLGQTTAPLKNAGESWSVIGNTFEALASGAAGAYTQDSGVTALGLSFMGNWFGDGNTTGTWVNVEVNGFTFLNNRLGNGASGITFTALSKAILIAGNYFDTIVTGITMGSAAHEGVAVLGNRFVGCTTDISTPGRISQLIGNSTNNGATFLKLDWPSPAVIMRDISPQTVVNTAVETSVFADNIPAGVMGISKSIKFHAVFKYNNNNAATAELTIRLNFGFTLIKTWTWTNIPVSASDRSIIISGVIVNAGTASAQVGSFRTFMSGAGFDKPAVDIPSGAGDIVNALVEGRLLAGENTAVQVTFNMTVQHDLANANQSVTFEQGVVVLE